MKQKNNKPKISVVMSTYNEPLNWITESINAKAVGISIVPNASLEDMLSMFDLYRDLVCPCSSSFHSSYWLFTMLLLEVDTILEQGHVC